LSWLLFACLGLVLAVFIAVAYRRGWRWTGFTENRRRMTDDEEVQPTKTLWDWLQLLVIPLALAGLAFLLDSSQTTREQRREDQREALQRASAADAAREEALRTYLTQMSGFMLDRELLRSRARADVRAVARTVTLTALRRLNGERKGLVVRFLVEARLVSSSDPKVDLHGANLRSAELKGALLAVRSGDENRTLFTEADLQGVDLRRADLRRAKLPGTLLVEADLRRADLRRADFEAAFGAGLPPADLSRAQLEGADFAGAELQGADLEMATYDSKTRWPEGFRPVAAGARRPP
jgi:uncharacterized protein YjbI with pentapeptide repeats